MPSLSAVFILLAALTLSAPAWALTGSCPSGKFVAAVNVGAIGQACLDLPDSNNATITPTNQSGISGATSAAVMLGLGAASSNKALFTPTTTGRVLLTITGSAIVGTGNDGVSLQCSYGTGTAPSNAGALAGTQLGNPVTFINANSATEEVPFSCTGIISGAALNTRLWLDLAVENITGGTATISGVTVSAVEI